jgi:hypothetical protein
MAASSVIDIGISEASVVERTLVRVDARRGEFYLTSRGDGEPHY